MPNARKTIRWTILWIKHKIPFFHNKCPIFDKKNLGNLFVHPIGSSEFVQLSISAKEFHSSRMKYQLKCIVGKILKFRTSYVLMGYWKYKFLLLQILWNFYLKTHFIFFTLFIYRIEYFCYIAFLKKKRKKKKKIFEWYTYATVYS